MIPTNLTTRQINDCKASINRLQREIIRLEGAKQNAMKTVGIEQWVGFTFRSSTRRTDEFREFVKDFKKYIRKVAGIDYELVSFTVGFFYCSGFFREKTSGKFIYFSTSDVRHFPDEWYNNVLVRTAKHEKDYTGGANCFTRLPDMKQAITTLI